MLRRHPPKRIFFMSIAAACLSALAAGCGGCGSDDNGGRGVDLGPGTTDSGTDAGNGSGTDLGPGVQTVTLSGRVLAPTGDFPVSGALVYLTRVAPTAIPSGVYDYECEDMAGKPYTLSAADGTWTIEDVPEGEWHLVTRKGNFRRIRDLTVTAEMDTNIANEMTTLPGESTPDGADTIPSFAVVRTSPDLTYNLLAKFGMGDMDSGGELIDGTEQFDIYNDSGAGSYPATSALFDAGVLDNYHMIFLPCYSSAVGVAFVNSHVQDLRDYVSRGGRIYNSCTVSLWSEAAFPEYIDFYQADDATRFDIGRRTNSAYTTTGAVLDSDLAAWLDEVAPGGSTNVPFRNGYVTIDATVEVDDGHGTDDDNGVVRPYTWVQDNMSYPGSPLMVTYNYDAGKVFYSVYETSEGSATITPQEYVLLYVLLEVGVCANLPPVFE